jgi:hypothetical protein
MQSELASMTSRAEDIKKLIERRTRRLNKLKEQEALQGKSVDPSVLIEIEDIETLIAESRSELEGIEAGLDKYALIWKDFRLKVDKLLPGTKHIFQAIDLFQQLRIPLSREMIVDLSARWNKSRHEKIIRILNELENFLLPKSPDPNLIHVIPAQCSNTGFSLRENEFSSDFFYVLDHFDKQIDL